MKIERKKNMYFTLSQRMFREAINDEKDKEKIRIVIIIKKKKKIFGLK